MCLHREGVMLSPSLSLHPKGYQEIRVDLVRISFIFVILYLKIKNALSISAVLTIAQVKGPNVQDIV